MGMPEPAIPDVGTTPPPKVRPPAPPARGASPPRVRLLDGLRGFSLVSMIAYHAMFDLVYIYGVRAAWYPRWPGFVWQQSICWVFILVAGASLHYGHHRWRHALTVLGCALALTLVTFVAMPGMLITFGVLHMLGVSLLLAAALWPLLQKVPWGAGLGVCLGLFAVLYLVPSGAVGFLGWPLAALPRGLYALNWLFPLGLPGPRFYSSDYFPLIPWTFLFFAGFFAWKPLKGRFGLTRPSAPGKNPLEWMGRHSLVIYMAHQPVIFGVLWLLQQAGVLNQ